MFAFVFQFNKSCKIKFLKQLKCETIIIAENLSWS